MGPYMAGVIRVADGLPVGPQEALTFLATIVLTIFMSQLLSLVPCPACLLHDGIRTWDPSAITESKMLACVLLT